MLTDEANRIGMDDPVSEFLASDEFTSVDPSPVDPQEVFTDWQPDE